MTLRHTPLGPPVHVERDDVRATAFWVTAATTVVVIVASVLIAGGLRRADAPKVAPAPPPPRAAAQIGIVEQTLIHDTERGLEQRVRQSESLQHFGWVDRGRGVVRVPIDRAMDLVSDPAFARQGYGLPPLADGGY